MTRSLNVTPKTALRSDKSEAKVTIIKDSARDSARGSILLRLTTDGHKASRGVSETCVRKTDEQTGYITLLGAGCIVMTWRRCAFVCW